MEVLLAAFVASLVTWLLTRSNYCGRIEDLRDALAHERRRRLQEEDRAETLSDALFGRVQMRHPSSPEMPN